jgi:ABC-2 type transport system ATP-binding protein
MIVTRGLAKQYERLKAVAGVDLEIRKGEIFGLLGPNGAGKTTTISMLCTLVRATAGSATVNGFDIAREPAQVRQSIGIVFQEQTLDTTLTARENLVLHARLYGVPKEVRGPRIAELFRLFDLVGREDDVVKKYSGGMRRRLEIARGLLHRPAVLFLDEPTVGLDPQSRVRTWDYIKRIARESGCTVVLTTHYMEEAELMCDRIAIIDHGKIIALGTPEQLKGRLGGGVVRVKAPDLDREGLGSIGFVRSVEQQDGWTVITVDDLAHNLPSLFPRLSGVQAVEVRSPTLNDVFIKLTGRELREESEGEGEGWAEAAMREVRG